jgi:hypothetical protein
MLDRLKSLQDPEEGFVNAYPVQYTEDEFLILYGYLEKETGHYHRMLKRKMAYVKELKGSIISDRLMHSYDGTGLLELFQMPLIDVPLHINDDWSHKRIVMNWRLAVAK